jgi:hypothetical protein
VRENFAIVLIVCGTFLALAPSVSNFIQGWQVAEAISGRPLVNTTGFFRQPLEESYSVGAWLLGRAMVGLGIIRGWMRQYR